VGKLADAIYEGRHGQLEVEEEYEDYEGALDDIDEDEEIGEIDSLEVEDDEVSEE
jgi:small subunit ribosomal protein S2